MENISGKDPNSNFYKPPKKANSSNSFLSLIVIILFVGVAAVLGVMGYQYMINSGESVPLVTEEENVVATPSGVIILTAANNGLPSIYSLDLGIEKPVLRNFPAFPVTAFAEFADKLNPATLFFNAATTYAEGEADKTGLHSWDISDNPINYYSNASGTTERDLNWSEAAQRLAFMRLKVAETDLATAPGITDYEIVIFDPAQNMVVTKIDGGVYPRWSPNGQILIFLREDGLYQFNLATNEVFKIVGPDESGAVLTPSEMLDVSRDGSRLVITGQNPGLITVFSITSWNPVTLDVIYTYKRDNEHYSAPVISPDKTMYVVLTTDRVDDKFINPRLEVRDMNSAEVLVTVAVDDFDMNMFFVNDWIDKAILFARE